MRWMLAELIGATLPVFAACAWARSVTQSPVGGEWGKLVTANNLDVKGDKPFHMGMTFQLYDLKGKQTETGSFETWSAAAASERTVVHLAGLNEDGSALEEALNFELSGG